MAGVFGFPEWLRRGVTVSVSVGSAASTMPSENLFDPQPGLRARFLPASGAVTLDFDFGAARAIGLVALVNTTLAGAEAVRVLLNLSDPTFAAGNLLDATRAPAGADRSRGAVVVLAPADVSARYLRLQITGVPVALLDIGSVMAMATVRPGAGMAFGATEGRRALGVMDRNEFTGAEFRTAGLAQPRYADFSLPSLAVAQYAGTVRDLIATTTPADDVAWVPDDALSEMEMNLRTVIGGIKTPGEEMGIARDRPLRGTAQFRIVERL